MSLLLTSMNSVNEAFRKAGSFDSDIGMFSGFTPLDILSANIEHAWDLAEMVDVNGLSVDLLNGGMFNFPYTEI